MKRNHKSREASSPTHEMLCNFIRLAAGVSGLVRQPRETLGRGFPRLGIWDSCGRKVPPVSVQDLGDRVGRQAPEHRLGPFLRSLIVPPPILDSVGVRITVMRSPLWSMMDWSLALYVFWDFSKRHPTRRKISAQSIPGSSGAPPGVGPPTAPVGAAAPGATLSDFAMRKLIA
jgi:hypothetical protein